MPQIIGAVTVGQSPREDVIPEMAAVMEPGTVIEQCGALDGLSRQDIAAFAPAEGDYVLVSRLKDGSWVRCAEKHILSRLQDCVCRLEARGAQAIVFLCTGRFPEIFTAKCPLIYPDRLLQGLVPAVGASRLAVLCPHEEQIVQSRIRWDGAGRSLFIFAANPYEGLAGVVRAAEAVKKAGADLVVMDCIGYTAAMKQAVIDIAACPVILPRTLVGRVLAELSGV
jgi:protein AroM